MAVTDDSLLMIAGILLIYLLFLWPKSFLKNILGGILLILVGIAGYQFMDTTQFWGVIVSIIGVIYVVLKLTKI